MRKFIALFAFVGLLLVGAISFVSSNVDIKSSVAFASVEVGYTELSPNGEAGGYAVPASHCSQGPDVGHFGDSGVPGACPPTTPTPSCPPGQTRNASGQCEWPPCPSGQTRNAQGQCEWPPCPTGQTRQPNGECVISSCPPGQVLYSAGPSQPPRCVPFCTAYPTHSTCTQTPPDPCAANPNAPGCQPPPPTCPDGSIVHPVTGECAECPNGSVPVNNRCECPAGQSCKPPTPPPPPPPDLSATAVCRADGTPSIRLSWDRHPNPLVTTSIVRCPGPSGSPSYCGSRANGWPTVASGVQPDWVDRNVQSGTRYHYSGSSKILFWPSTALADIVRITAPTCEPGDDITVDLEIQRPDTNPGTWSDDDINDLGLTEDVQLRWTSNGATQCDGTNFITNGTTNGQQNNVTEPEAGDTTRYTVICRNSTGNASDSIDVTRIDGEGDGPSITADPGSVDSGDDADVVWNVGENDPAACTLTADNGGTGLPDSYAAALAAPNGTDTVTITETTTFTITCPNGSASAIIRAIPKIFES